MAAAAAEATTAAASQAQASQSGLIAAVSPAVEAAWQQMNPDDLGASIGTLSQHAQAIATKYGKASSAISALHYAQERKAAGVAGRFSVPHAEPPGADEVKAQIQWATRSLWSETPNYAAAKTNVQGVVSRLVLNQGRETTLNAVRGDQKASGYAREVEPGACSFCILLATRGAVYKGSSFNRSNTKFNGTGEFKTHDHCECLMVPVFGQYEPTANIRHYQQVYKDVTQGVRGAKAMRNAFRQAVDSDRS